MPIDVYTGGITYDIGNTASDPDQIQSSVSGTVQITLGKTVIATPWLGAGIGDEINSHNDFILNAFGFAAGQGVNRT